jgi:regulatory protein
MRKITELRQQKRNKDRVSVFLDGTFAFGLTLEAAAGLRVGQELSDAAIAQLQDRETMVRARQSAFRFVSYRPRSVAEVRRSLLNKEYDEVVVEAIVSDLVERDYLNDETFAKYWVEQRETFKPRSRLALRQELYEKGVPREIIRRAVRQVDEVEAAERAAEKRAYRWSHYTEEAFREKMIAYLGRRGFNYTTAKKATDGAWSNLQDNETPSQRR